MTVLEAMALPIDFEVLPEGAAFAAMERAEGEAVIRAAIDKSDTVLYGSTSGKTGGMTYLRWGRGTYANVRPIKWRPGVPSPLRQPEGIDYVIVRENIEDLYGGIEGDLASLLASGLDTRPWGGRIEARYPPSAASDGRYAVKVITRECTELCRPLCLPAGPPAKGPGRARPRHDRGQMERAPPE